MSLRFVYKILREYQIHIEGFVIVNRGRVKTKAHFSNEKWALLSFINIDRQSRFQRCF